MWYCVCFDSMNKWQTLYQPKYFAGHDIIYLIANMNAIYTFNAFQKRTKSFDKYRWTFGMPYLINFAHIRLTQSRLCRNSARKFCTIFRIYCDLFGRLHHIYLIWTMDSNFVMVATINGSVVWRFVGAVGYMYDPMRPGAVCVDFFKIRLSTWVLSLWIGSTVDAPKKKNKK